MYVYSLKFIIVSECICTYIRTYVTRYRIQAYVCTYVCICKGHVVPNLSYAPVLLIKIYLLSVSHSGKISQNTFLCSNKHFTICMLIVCVCALILTNL